MSNVFSAKRFGKYFVYDLGRAKDNFGLSLLILGLLPVAFYVLYQLFSLIGPAHSFGSGAGFSAYRGLSLIIAVFVAVAVFPVKVYGPLTDKRSGSAFLMLPASTLEKWLSMVLITCIVLPVCLAVLYMGSDLVMGLVFPKTYGTPLLSQYRTILSDFASANEFDSHGVNPGWALALNWCFYVLAFPLGSMYFKKGKVGLTLLSLFGIVVLVLIVLSSFSLSMGGDLAVWLENLNPDPEKAFRIFIGWAYALTVLEVLAVLGLTYLRMRTIKH